MVWTIREGMHRLCANVTKGLEHPLVWILVQWGWGWGVGPGTYPPPPNTEDGYYYFMANILTWIKIWGWTITKPQWEVFQRNTGKWELVPLIQQRGYSALSLSDLEGMLCPLWALSDSPRSSCEACTIVLGGYFSSSSHIFIEQSIWEKGHQIQFPLCPDPTPHPRCSKAQEISGSHPVPRDSLGYLQSPEL